MAKDRGGIAEAQGDADLALREAALVENKDLVDEVGYPAENGVGGLAMEAQGLGDDVGDPSELGLGLGDVLVGAGVFCGLLVGEVEEVGDGFEGIVDLVGDGAGHASDGGELLTLTQSGFCLEAFLDVENQTSYSAEVAVAVEVWSVGDLSVSGAVDGGVLGLEGDGLTLEDAGTGGEGAGPVRVPKQLADGFADDRGGGEAHPMFVGAVDADEASGWIDVGEQSGKVVGNEA